MALIILAVETATSCQSVAVLQESTILAQSHEVDHGFHSRTLVLTIQTMLDSIGLELKQLNAMAVSIGPGSFTGLRVGLATLMGFRLVTGLPLIAVPTLEAMAWNFPQTPYPLCPLLKAGRGEVYWARFQWRNGQLIRLSDDAVDSVMDFAQAIQTPTLVYGEGWILHQKEITHILGSHAVAEAFDGTHPSAVNVAQLGSMMLKEGQIVQEGLSPRYIHPSYAKRHMNSSNVMDRG